MNEFIKEAFPHLLTLIGVIITVVAGNKSTRKIIEYRIEQLEKKQDMHNQLIGRMYEAEKKLEVHEEQIKVSNHRIDDLEHLHTA